MDPVDGFCDWLKHNKGRSDATADKYRQALQRLHAYLEEHGRTFATATLDDLEAFTGLHAHQQLRLKPRARRPLVAAVRGFYTWAYPRGYVAENTASYLAYPRAGKPLPRAMSLSNAEALFMQCDLDTFIGVRDAAIISVLIGCGPRISGVCSLNEESLVWYRDDEDQERLSIRFVEKGSKERLVPAPRETALMLHAYLGHHELEEIDRALDSGERVLFVSTHNTMVPPHEYHGSARRLSARAVFDRLRRYGELAGIPKDELHPHALRHLYGTELAEHDVDLLLRQELMGHEDPKSTKIYTALAQRKKASAVEHASPMKHIRSPVSDLARHLDSQRKPRTPL